LDPDNFPFTQDINTRARENRLTPRAMDFMIILDFTFRHKFIVGL